MTRRRSSRWLAHWTVCLACAAVCTAAKEAVAMSCAPTPLATVARQAAAIFEATVVAVTVHPRPETLNPDGTVSVVAAPQQATATLTDVTAIRGVPATTIESVERALVAGRRYLIVAMVYPQRPGVLVAGGCAGYVRPAARADAFKAWLESLELPATGGRILGSVVARSTTSDVTTWPSVSGARITVRGPVIAEATSDADGQFAIAGLADGSYEVSVALPEDRHGLLAPKPLKATLDGAHAVWDWDLRADVDGVVTGRVVDVNGRAVGGAPVFLHAHPRSIDPGDLAYWIGKSDGAGRYEFRGVPPGHYVVTIDEPFTPAYARMVDGGDELVVGHAERLELAPLVATRGPTILVEGLLVDAGGRPLESAFRVEVLGSLGPYPKSGSTEVSDASGRFRLRLFRGLRYRLSLFVPNDAASVTVDYVADGTPIKLVEPKN